jgi:hypothetical protein
MLTFQLFGFFFWSAICFDFLKFDSALNHQIWAPSERTKHGSLNGRDVHAIRAYIHWQSHLWDVR